MWGHDPLTVEYNNEYPRRNQPAAPFEILGPIMTMGQHRPPQISVSVDAESIRCQQWWLFAGDLAFLRTTNIQFQFAITHGNPNQPAFDQFTE